MNAYQITQTLTDIMSGGKQYWMPKGQIVDQFNDAHRFHLILEGFVKRYLINRDGGKSIQLIYGPGDVFPMTPLYQEVFQMPIYKGQETYYYEAMTNIKISSVAMSELKAYISKNPIIYKDLYYASGVRLNSYINRLEDMSLKNTNLRIANLLLFFAKSYGSPTPDGTKIGLPLTHQDISEILDLSRETVSRSLKTLKTNDYISGNKNFVVKDLKRLRGLLE